MKSIFTTFLISVLAFYTISAQSNVIINELMASNDTAVADQDGEFDDWIELYNLSLIPSDLTGYFLTDNLENLTKYDIPEGTTVPGGGYIIIWADEDGMQDGLHANFKLSAGGEAVYLVNPLEEIENEVVFMEQETDMGYARVPNGVGSFVIQAPSFSANNDFLDSTNEIPDVTDIVSFPNPATKYIELKWNKQNQETLKVSLYNISGQQVNTQHTRDDHIRLDLENLSNGIYFIQVGNSKAYKIVLER
jgi:hypothetical protein